MKVLFDTSILVAALVDSHPKHSVSFPWLTKAKNRKIEGFVATHTLAELYAVLTSLPIQRKASTSEIWQLIEKSVLANFEIV